jgi:P-type Cu2+ transporter
VSCPCALGLAAPLVQAMATARAAARGIVLRDPEVLETLGRSGGVAHFVFDKTGTLTEGRMRVTGWTWLQDIDEVRRGTIEAMVLAAEAPSAHPIAFAIVTHLGGREPARLSARTEITGQGVIAHSALGELRIGNERLTGVTQEGVIADDAAVGSLGVTLDGQPVARISCADPLRSGAAALVQDLCQRGAQVHLLSGDDVQITAAMGAILGLPPAAVRGAQSPEDKAARITELKRTGTVVVIGDGINDAAALATADVGIGLRGGIEAALGSCRVAMVRHDGIAGLGEVINGAIGARRCVRRILAVSLAYNVVGVMLAAAGIWGPLVCAVAMPISSLTAVLMAGGGRYFRRG